MAASRKLGLYFHIPFCLSKCPYCDFYSLRFQEEAADRYLDGVLRALSRLPEEMEDKDFCVDSIYFGGGTPVLMGTRLIRILDAASKKFLISPGCEITLEANPAAMTLAELSLLRKGGLNRLSLGVQASNDQELKRLGRLHSFEQAVESVEAAAKAGFSNCSVDLMLGTPGQTMESIDHFAAAFSALPVQHISGYLLHVEEGTPFAKRHIEALCPDEDASADLYLHTVEVLEAHGFRQYEVSNFAMPGYESRHNLKYWHCDEYLGIGPAAHSFLNGKRFFFPRDWEGFCGADTPWSLAQMDGEGGDFFEYAMLRLRLTEGISFPAVEKRYPDQNLSAFKQAAKRLEPYGLLCLSENGVRLTPKGFLLSNPVIGELLEEGEREQSRS